MCNQALFKNKTKDTILDINVQKMRDVYYQQIALDFQQIYGDKSINSEKWNDFFSRNWFYITKNIKSLKGLTQGLLFEKDFTKLPNFTKNSLKFAKIH